MTTPTIHDQLAETISRLTDEQAAALLQVAQLIQSSSPASARAYDKDADVLRKGLFEGPPDLAGSVEDILWGDAG